MFVFFCVKLRFTLCGHHVSKSKLCVRRQPSIFPGCDRLCEDVFMFCCDAASIQTPQKVVT